MSLLRPGPDMQNVNNETLRLLKSQKMEFFQNIFEFYRRNLFTDLAISTIDSQGCIHQVCHVHRLVFVSLFPRLKDVLQENDKTL